MGKTNRELEAEVSHLRKELRRLRPESIRGPEDQQAEAWRAVWRALNIVAGREQTAMEAAVKEILRLKRLASKRLA